ncbi:MAG: hypothetical protein HZB39_17920 [Planctomycetes bacterium]|nr:hypothetical protein [Planctomycetota bacterium]
MTNDHSHSTDDAHRHLEEKQPQVRPVAPTNSEGGSPASSASAKADCEQTSPSMPRPPGSIWDGVTKGIGYLALLALVTLGITFSLDWAAPTLARKYSIPRNNTELRGRTQETQLLKQGLGSVAPQDPRSDSSSTFGGLSQETSDSLLRYHREQIAANKERERQERLAAFNVAAKADPDFAAKVQRLARDTGIPVSAFTDEERARAGEEFLRAQRIRELDAQAPKLREFLRDLPSKQMLTDDAGNLKTVSGPFDWWLRNLQFGDTESRIALLVVLLTATFLLLAPAILCWHAVRHWQPRSRAGYACRLALWGVAILGWPTIPVLLRVADGDFTHSPTEALLSALATGATWSAILGFLSFGLGSWLGGKRFGPAVHT